MAASFQTKPNIKLNPLTNQYPLITQLSPIIPFLPKSPNFPRLITNPRLTLKCSVTTENLKKNPVLEVAKTRTSPFEIVANAILKPIQESTFVAVLFMVLGVLLYAPNPALAATGGRVGELDFIPMILYSVFSHLVLNKPETHTSVIKLQVGLLGSVRSIQKDLNRITATADASKQKNMTYILTETTLSLLRHAHCCISGYTSVDVKTSDFEQLLNQFSIEERGKFSEETLVNVNNEKKQCTSRKESTGFNNEYILITILAGANGVHKLPTINSSEDLKESLKLLGSISSSDIWAVEVLWTPQKENDTLTEPELRKNYPDVRFFKQLF